MAGAQHGGGELKQRDAVRRAETRQAKAGQSDANDAVFLTTSPLPISVPIPAGTASDGLSLMFLVRGGHPDAHQCVWPLPSGALVRVSCLDTSSAGAVPCQRYGVEVEAHEVVPLTSASPRFTVEGLAFIQPTG
jgi:hypothetical protein